MEFSSTFAQTMTKLANKSFFESFDATDTVFQDLFEVKDVSKMGGLSFGQGTELLGEGEPDQIGYAGDHHMFNISEGFTYFWALKLFQRGFEVNQDMLDNWKHNPMVGEDYVKTRAKLIGEAMKQFRDKYAAQIFNRGSIAAGDINYFNGTKPGLQVDTNPGKIYDGQAFFDDAHPLFLDANTTFDNYTTSLAFSPANLQNVLTAIRVTNAKDEHNRPIKNDANVVVYNPALDWTVRTVLESEKITGSANNDKNLLKGVIRPVSWHYITDATAWYTGEAKKGLLFLHKGDPASSSTVDKMRGRGIFKWSMTDEFTAVVTQWRHWYAADVAES